MKTLLAALLIALTIPTVGFAYTDTSLDLHNLTGPSDEKMDDENERADEPAQTSGGF